MKTTTKVIFASALMLSAVAPTLSYATYFVDQTKTWALETRAQDVMDKVTHVTSSSNASFKGTKSWIFMAPATRQCPELVLTRTTRPRSPNNRRDRQRLGTRRCHFFYATPFRFLLHPSRSNARMSTFGTTDISRSDPNVRFTLESRPGEKGEPRPALNEHSRNGHGCSILSRRTR